MRRRKSAEERRDEIVAATLRLASEESPERVTTEAIARAVGITQAAVFRHFSSKSGIWVAVAAWLAETAPCRWREAAAGPASPP
ncbi:MAG: TetR/AcrR family transcriptional regulator, partial [Magnetospirillum sp. WYHS-4]